MTHHLHSDDYKEEYIFLQTRDIGLDVLVKTKHKQLQQFIEDEKNNSYEENATIFMRVWTAIKEATKDGIDKIYEVEPEWSNLCDDIFIFYALRWLLFKKPVPIVCNSVVEEVLSISHPDPCEVQEAD